MPKAALLSSPELLCLDKLIFDTTIYPREQWRTTTVDRYVDCLKRGDQFLAQAANVLLRHGTIKRAARVLLCAESFLYDRLTGSWLYFFRLETCVKIGYTEQMLHRIVSFRLHTGGAGSFETIFTGQKADEQALHQVFVAHHRVGEWFHMSCPNTMQEGR